MVSEALANKIFEFSKKYNIQIRQENIKPWGSYEPIFSLDGKNWFHAGQMFGWGYSDAQAFSTAFTRIVNEDIFKSWLGEERHKELIEIING